MSEEVLLHFEVQRGKSTQPNASSINSSAESTRVRAAQRHSACRAATSRALAAHKTPALQKLSVLLTHTFASSPRPAPAQFGNPAEGSPKQEPGGDVLGGCGKPALGSSSCCFSCKDQPASFLFMQGHSAREEILTENELSGKKSRDIHWHIAPLMRVWFARGKSDSFPRPPAHGRGSSCSISARFAGSA